MGLPFTNNIIGARRQTVAIVLGARTTKGVLVQREGDAFRLLNYTLCETPALDPQAAPELLGEHLKNVFKSLEARTREFVLVIGMGDVLLRTAELPFYEPARARQVVKLNARTYVQQELTDHEVDCSLADKASAEIIRARPTTPTIGQGEGGVSGAAAPEAKAQPRYRALVGAAPKALVEKLRSAAKAAGLEISKLTFSQTSLANAVSLARPEIAKDEVVALVDLGFKTSTVSILCNSQLYLTRVVGLGGDHFTKSLADNLGVNYAAAEGVKLLMPEKVEPKLRKLIATLTQELRTVIDFFEDQEVKRVSRILVTGGSARSNFVIETLHDELGTPCERLDPTSFLEVTLPPLKTGDLGKDGPQLAAAIGAAVTWERPEAQRINLLAEEQEAEEMRRRNPVRRGLVAAGLICFVMLSLAGVFWLRDHVKKLELQGAESELQGLEKGVDQVLQYSRQAGASERTALALDEQAANRSLWALPLSALQYVSVKEIQVVRLSIRQTLIRPPPAAPRPKEERAAAVKPQPTSERLILTLEAKNYGDPVGVDRFIEAIGSQAYFRQNLREVNPVVLISRLPPQADPVDPSRTFTLFTVQCVYRDRILGYE